MKIPAILQMLLLVMLMLMAGGCSNGASSPESKLMIGTNVWPGYELLYLAREKGYVDEDAVQLIEYTSSSDVIRSFRNGVINAAALTLDEALLLQAQNFANKVVLVLDISEGADVVMVQEGVADMASLKGKKVGVEESALGAFVLSRALDIAKISPEEITIVPLEVSEHEEAMKSGLVDAVVTFDPVRTKLLEWGCKEVFTSREIPGEIVDVLVVDDAFMKRSPATVSALIAAWSKARSYMQNSPDEAAGIMGKRQGVSAEQFLASLEGLHLPTLEENREYFAGTEPLMYRNSLKLLEVLRRKGLIENEAMETKSMFIPGWLER